MPGGVRRRLSAAIVVFATLAVAASPAGAETTLPDGSDPAAPDAKAGPFPDVPSDHWAVDAIRFVTNETREWIPARTEGFEPEAPFTRRDLARAMFRVFPPPKSWSGTRTFADVDADDPMLDAFRWAVKKSWLRAKDGLVRPGGRVSRNLLDPAVVRALGYGPEAWAVSKMRTEDGIRVVTKWTIGFLFAANRLDLHPNRSNDGLEVLPGQPMSRAYAATVFQRIGAIQATDRASIAWRFDGYREIVLPKLSPARLAAARFALAYAGYPYVWAGEYRRSTGKGYPYGRQVQGGFDCTGFAWWVLHKPYASGYDAPKWRGYAGWELPWRTATEMAVNTRVKRTWDEVKPLDLAFYDFDGDRTRIDHAGLLLGNGWLVHSSGSKGGVTLERVSKGYMLNAFVFARRVIPPKE